MATTSFTKQFRIEIKSEEWEKFVGNYVDSGKALTIDDGYKLSSHDCQERLTPNLYMGDFMGKSYRKTPIRGITSSESEKKDKQIYNRRWRRKSKVAIENFDHDNEDYMEPTIHEIVNYWNLDKDGKRYFGNSEHITLENKKKLMRK